MLRAKGWSTGARAIVAGPPMVIGIGLDLVETARVGRALERHGERFVRKLMDPEEAAAPSRGRPRARALPGPRDRGQGGSQQGARDGLEPRRAVARRRRLPRARGRGAARGPRRRGGAGAGLERPLPGAARGAGAARPRRALAALVTAPSPVTAASARRNQLVTVAMVFAVFTGFAFVLPFLPLFVRELGVEEPDRAALWAGVLIGVAPLLAGLLAPVWGRLADRHGHKRIAVTALASYVVILALSAAVTTRRGAARAADRDRPLRRHRAAGAGHGHRPGAARGDRPRRGPHPGRADPLRRDRPVRGRDPGRHDRHPSHVPRHRRALRRGSRPRARLLRGKRARGAKAGRRRPRASERSSRCPGSSRCSSSSSS